MQLLGPTGDQIDLLLPYRMRRSPRPGRSCWVLANMVCSLDGNAAIGGRVGALSHGDDAELFRQLRSVADVVLVGAQTVRCEGYGPVKLLPALRDERIADGRPPDPPLAIVSRSLQLDWSAPAFTGKGPARTIVVTTETAGAEAIAAARAHAEVLVAGDDRVDLAQALSQLRDRGCEVVLCEGGPTLLGQLVADDLLDELCLSVSPMMGGDPLPVSVTPEGTLPTSFELRHVALDGGTLFLRYETSADAQ